MVVIVTVVVMIMVGMWLDRVRIGLIGKRAVVGSFVNGHGANSGSI